MELIHGARRSTHAKTELRCKLRLRFYQRQTVAHLLSHDLLHRLQFARQGGEVASEYFRRQVCEVLCLCSEWVRRSMSRRALSTDRFSQRVACSFPHRLLEELQLGIPSRIDFISMLRQSLSDGKALGPLPLSDLSERSYDRERVMELHSLAYSNESCEWLHQMIDLDQVCDLRIQQTKLTFL